jgi:anthranilate/para-aminobenzoate synthase component I
LSIIIRSAICKQGAAYFQVGAGIVADSDPEAEYEETLAKAAGFLGALDLKMRGTGRLRVPPPAPAY